MNDKKETYINRKITEIKERKNLLLNDILWVWRGVEANRILKPLVLSTLEANRYTHFQPNELVKEDLSEEKEEEKEKSYNILD